MLIRMALDGQGSFPRALADPSIVGCGVGGRSFVPVARMRLRRVGKSSGPLQNSIQKMSGTESPGRGD